MERYHSLYWIYVILGPLILGLIALFLIVLPGDTSMGRMLLALGIYLAIAIGGSAIVTRHLDR